MKTCRANYVSLNARIDRLTSIIVERETLTKEMCALIQMLRLDTDQQGIVRQRIDDVLAAREEDV